MLFLLHAQQWPKWESWNFSLCRPDVSCTIAFPEAFSFPLRPHNVHGTVATNKHPDGESVRPAEPSRVARGELCRKKKLTGCFDIRALSLPSLISPKQRTEECRVFSHKSNWIWGSCPGVLGVVFHTRSYEVDFNFFLSLVHPELSRLGRFWHVKGKWTKFVQDAKRTVLPWIEPCRMKSLFSPPGWGVTVKQQTPLCIPCFSCQKWSVGLKGVPVPDLLLSRFCSRACFDFLHSQKDSSGHPELQQTERATSSKNRWNHF